MGLPHLMRRRLLIKTYQFLPEVRYAAIYNGCDVHGLEDGIDEGMWGHELVDPSTIQAASLCTPIGTWAKGEPHLRAQNKTAKRALECSSGFGYTTAIIVYGIAAAARLYGKYKCIPTQNHLSIFDYPLAAHPWVASDAQEIWHTARDAK